MEMSATAHPHDSRHGLRFSERMRGLAVAYLRTYPLGPRLPLDIARTSGDYSLHPHATDAEIIRMG